jgi:Flp pilus assembly protein TadG
MKPANGKRRGAAVVEMAVVAPLIFLLFMAAFEFARLNMIRHTTEVAAFEGCRRGIVPGATTDAVRNRVQTVLAAIGIDDATVEIEPTTLTRADLTITVQVTVAWDQYTWLPARFAAASPIQRSCTLRREQF